MHIRSILVASGAALLPAVPAAAADQLKFGGAPSWVAEQVIPPASNKVKDKPVAILLHDQQTMLEPGKISTFSELAFKIQKPEGLAAGNLSIAWNPAFDTATVNRLEIHRGDQVIDVLKSGQTFTTMRRESNLELAMLDGVLTANIQPEGLQAGDIVVLAYTAEHSDPVLKGHVETTFAPWGEAQIGLAHARLAWPAAVNVKVQETGDLPVVQSAARGDRKVIDVTMHDVEPVIDPKGAPLRFNIGRMGEASDFRSWADAARLMMPLYGEAAVIPRTGPLRDEVEKIRKASADPKTRAEQALQLVQQRVRYVALAMGEGGLVPARAEETWSRRFGDCKAKTALLLAILHEFGIAAEPVLVNALAGDAVSDFLPMIGAFNHVLVRAHVDGREYWLDGTRTGDTSLDQIKVPNFGWGLPLIENAALIHLVPPPLDVPDSETRIAIDATAGVFAPAKVEIAQIARGDGAVGFEIYYNQLSTEQQTQFVHESAKRLFNSISGDSSTVAFDAGKRELKISTKGTAKLDWKDGWYSVPSSSIGFNADFERTIGPQHDAPVATNYPNFDKRTVTIKLPSGFATGQKKLPQPVHETLAGVEYKRVISLSADVLTIESSERSIVPEVPYKTALADAPRLKSLDKEDVYLQVPGSYRSSKEDLTALASDTPGSADEYERRGNTYLDAFKFDAAIADFTKALELEPKRATTLADRGITYVWNGDYLSAEKDLTASEALDPNNVVIFRARGLMAQRKGDPKAAVDGYTRALAIQPQDPFALGHRAEAYRSLKEDEKALSDSEQALRGLPDWFDLRMMRATMLLLAGKKDLASAEASKLIANNPTSSRTLVEAARIYARLGDKEEAMRAFERALAIKPEAYIYLNRAQSRPFTDQSGRVADLDAALKLDPKNIDALAEKAEQLSAASDFKSALALYDQIKNIVPDNRYAAIRRAIILYKTGSTTEAETLLSAARKDAKTSSDFNNLCWAKATAGILLEDALKDCEQALKLNSDSGQAIDSLAFVKLRTGELDGAIALYDRAIAKDTGSASYMGRAIAYARKGDSRHAEADREEALKLDPDAVTRFAEYGLKFDQPSGVATARKN